MNTLLHADPTLVYTTGDLSCMPMWSKQDPRPCVLCPPHFHLSCPFKIRHLNLGVFPAAIELKKRKAEKRRWHPAGEEKSIKRASRDRRFFFFQMCFIPGGLVPCLLTQTRGGPPAARAAVQRVNDHLWNLRDDMNVTRSRSALPTQQPRPDSARSAGKPTTPAFGWIRLCVLKNNN